MDGSDAWMDGPDGMDEWMEQVHGSVERWNDRWMACEHGSIYERTRGRRDGFGNMMNDRVGTMGGWTKWAHG